MTTSLHNKNSGSRRATSPPRTNGSGALREAEKIVASVDDASLFRERFLLGALLKHVPDSIYFKDTQSRFIRINKALAERFGLNDPAQAIGKTDFDFFSEAHARPAFEDEQEVMRTGVPVVDKEEKETWPDGRETWALTTKLPYRDHSGRIIGTFGISRDITAWKQTEEALRNSERRYRQLSEAALDGLVVADEDGRIRLFNAAAERMFGYEAREVMGEPLTCLMPAQFRERHERGFQRFLATREARILGTTVELRGRRKDGSEFPIEISLNAVDIGGSLQFLGAIRDVSERDRLRAVMLQTEKLASIGLLSAGIAHEINNPLAYVASNLAVAERDTRNLLALVEACEAVRDRVASVDQEAALRLENMAEEMDLPYIRENLGTILTRTREGLQRVTRIIQSLRSLGRTTPPKLEEAALPALVEMGLDMMRGRLQRRGIVVETDYGNVRTLRCIPTQLAQALLNLLTNAMQALEASGRTSGLCIRLTSRYVSGQVLIEVADNGCGIAAEDLPQIFDPFFTTKPVGEGTGLGLALTHSIITGHGGRIEVDSRPDVGTRFRVFLPIHGKEASDARAS